MFNAEQIDHMRDLSRLAEQGKLCACGWESKDNCSRYCLSPAKRDAAIRAKMEEQP